jgi:hypothetical protein
VLDDDVGTAFGVTQGPVIVMTLRSSGFAVANSIVSTTSSSGTSFATRPW